MGAGPGEGVALNTFVRDGDTVYRVWGTEGHGSEQLSHLFGILDALPHGRRRSGGTLRGAAAEGDQFGVGVLAPDRRLVRRLTSAFALTDNSIADALERA